MTHTETILRRTIDALRRIVFSRQREIERLRVEIEALKAENNRLSHQVGNYQETEYDRPENHEMGQ